MYKSKEIIDKKPNKKKISDVANNTKYVVIDATATTTMAVEEWAQLLYLLQCNPSLRVSQLLSQDIQKLLDDAQEEYGSLFPLVM